MAVVQIYRYEFIQNNTYGGFVAGDVLDVFLETDDALVPALPINNVATGITVNKNGTPLSSSSTLLNMSPSVVSTQEFNPQICIGTSLLVIQRNVIFPFGKYYSLENHYSCVVNPPTCNLIVVGIPSVTPATTDTSTDGAITVTGSSSNPIQYKIGSDFSYNDGTAQHDGHFGGLLPGSYRVFLRDSANCGVNVLAVIPVDNTYGPKYRLEYKDIKGWNTRVDITQRGYSGPVIEICGSGTPLDVSLRGEGSIDKFISMLSTSATLNLTSEEDLQFIELYTNDPNLYRQEYSKDFGSGWDLKLLSKVLPQQYQEEYKAPPYYVSVTSTDGLPELKDFYLVQEDGLRYYGTVKTIKLIANCLSVLKLNLPIRVACNLYATTMSQTDSDDPLDQAYCDFERFYIADKEPTLDFVLKSILEPFGACIKQWNGRWNIVRVEEMVAEYDFRDFDSNGDYTGNGSYNPIKDLDFPVNNGDLMLANRDHNLEIMPGYGIIRGIYKQGLKPNILRNGDFRVNATFNNILNTYVFSINKDGWTLVNAGYALDETYEQLSEGNVAYKITGGASTTGNAYLQSDSYYIKMGTNNQLKFSIKYKITDPSFGVGSLWWTPDVPYIKVRVRIKYGSLYLRTDGSWSTTENEVIFYAEEYNKYLEGEIIAKQPTSGAPGSGMSFDVRVYHAFTYHAQFLSKASLKAFPTAGLHGGTKTELKTGEFSGTYIGIYFYKLQESTEANDEFNIIRPNDYNGSTNPYQWIRETGYPAAFDLNYLPVPTIEGKHGFCIDTISIQYLTDGKDPIDTVVRSIAGEAQNKEVLEKELILGSYSNVIVTETKFSLDLGFFFPNQKPGLSLTTVNALSADILYTGYFRNSSGVGYENWARDGIAESDKLHGILLKTYAGQYKRSWRLLRGSVYTNQYFDFIDVIRNVNDSNRIYMPVGLTLNDKMCIYTGEFLELINDKANPGSTGSGDAPYSSGFSRGFGSAFK